MKRVLAVLIGLTGAIALTTDALAQAINLTEPTAITPTELLTPEPASIERSKQLDRPSQSAFSADKLNTAAKSIQAKSTNSEQSIIPKDLIPMDVIHTPKKRSSDTNALDFFQVPELPPSVGINFKAD